MAHFPISSDELQRLNVERVVVIQLLALLMSFLLRARPISIQWHNDLPIFAAEHFLRSVGDEFGWLGGFDEAGHLRCILPYTIVHKAMLRMVRFRVETIACSDPLSIAEEKRFLNSAMDHFRARGADLVIPATTNSVFRIYPKDAVAAPYGSYVLDLPQPEETLWTNLHGKHRNVIRNAMKKGVQVYAGLEHTRVAHQLIEETLNRSGLRFMSFTAFQRLLATLRDNILLLTAVHEGVMQGCAVIPFSHYSGYYVYGGSIAQPLTGAINLLHWEAIRMLRASGVRRYDFVGVRIAPDKGSKQDGLRTFKERFGGRLSQGYIWKYSFRPLKYRFYCLAARLRSHGDIVDHERHKLRNDP